MDDKLNEILHHVDQGRRIVAEQKLRLILLRSTGREFAEAEALLETFETTLAIFEMELAQIRAQSSSRLLADANSLRP